VEGLLWLLYSVASHPAERATDDTRNSSRIAALMNRPNPLTPSLTAPRTSGVVSYLISPEYGIVLWAAPFR
jgi:hypothetical protein